MRSLLITAVLLCAAYSAIAQEPEPIEEMAAEGIRAQAVEKPDPEIISAIVESVEYMDLDDDSELRSAIRDMLLAAAKHEARKVEIVREALLVQKIAAYVAFTVAHLLLGAGLTIGFLEYRRVRDIKKQGGLVDNIDISIGVENIALKATMGATLALAFCFGFYGLYVAYIFPIASL